MMTELPKLSTSYQPGSAHPRELNSSQPQQPPSLPSFAALSEQASRGDDGDEVEIAPMSARLSCNSCYKLSPLIRDIAITVAELDENIQQYCNKSNARVGLPWLFKCWHSGWLTFLQTSDFPKDNPIRAAQWILERLVKTKIDLQDTARRMQAGYPYAQASTTYPGISSRTASPPSGLKRSSDPWDQAELPLPKRPRSGASYAEISRTAGPREDRRASIDFAPRSPPPTESVPGSAYPRIGSPGLSARPHRTLPSPSSLAYPLSAAPSLAPATVPSVGSPTTSIQPAMSIHTASSSSATSAHIADLQHQVTLKSLALQTLQSEYASLLQKLQRERVKSQTIEKKTSVADQEVNELTSRNEDLTEQIKALESQLEECEKKRETERLTAASERDQWTKLLAMDRQLQSKNAEEKQKLRDEKMLLSQRVAAYEDDNISRFDQLKRSNPSRTSATRSDSDRNFNEELNLAPAATTGGSSPANATNNDAESLRTEVAMLNNRIEILRFSLEDAKRRSLRLGQQTQEIADRNVDITAAIDRALEDDNAAAKISRSGSQVRPTVPSPTAAPAGQPNSSRTLSQSPNHLDPPSAVQTNASSSSTASIASIARAISPSPAELGFHVAPSTSTPEELIAALGPVPSIQFTSGRASGKRGGNSAPRKKSRKRNAEVVAETSNPTTNFQFGAFRPLEQPAPPTYSSMSQPEHAGTATYIYASSPGSMAGSSSPGSSGSESRRTSGEGKNAASVHGVSHSMFTAGLPSPGPSTDGYSISAMPPPPRPSMNLRDLCSVPPGAIARP